MSEVTQTLIDDAQAHSQSESRITARDLRSVFWRSFTLQGSWNYERQQHMGYAFAMSPALKRIYQDPAELGRALQRHLVLFNTTPHLSTFVFGLSIAMEEENQRNPNFNEESINAVKTSLMGPLAGIGDSIFWGSLKVIAAGMGIYFAQQGSILGPILALLVYNIPHILCRWYALKLGYRAGDHLADAPLAKRADGQGDLYRVNRRVDGRRRHDRQHDRHYYPAELYRRADYHESAGFY
ncbi:PTS family sugar transport protein component IID [Salmonella enterica subsp. enterica]|uniref:PTS family sugar transport protein component IID n=1 Tax=Salmonella enterica I TaxID=59201 RepID=A0A447PQA2_SALET|nr:PTS family sugar transport protein component IID [Salmonella enterica subsp. enterica]